MSFDVTADAYGRFMGRYADPLAVQFLDYVGAHAGQRALDVGCGPGTLTALLVERLGIDAVAAVDPSEPFVSATRSRLPGLDVRAGAAEQLPFADAEFDLTTAQLVVHFMSDPVEGLREMARVTRPGGVVAACVWDHAGGSGPLSLFWRVVHEVDPETPGEAELPGTRQGHLGELASEAGLTDLEEDRLSVRVPCRDFDQWWEPYTLGVGPAGAYVAKLDDTHRAELRARCAEQLPSGAFDITATAWCLRARR